MRGVMSDQSQRKKRELHSGPPCPHYPHKYKTEAAHQGKLASRRRTHARMQKHNLDYRLRALLATIEHRCNSPKHNSYRWYGGKGVRNFLTLNDLKTLWVRDNANKMRKPSIDRRESNGDYTFENSFFNELRANQQRAWENKEARTKAIREGMLPKPQTAAA